MALPVFAAVAPSLRNPRGCTTEQERRNSWYCCDEAQHNYTHLIAEVCSVHCLKVDGFYVTKSTIRIEKDYRIKSRCSVDGYEWEIQFRLAYYKQSVDE